MSFRDVPDGARYAKEIEFAQKISVMVGDEKGDFNPTAPMRRKELCVVICNLFDLDVAKYSGCKGPVEIPAWVRPYFLACQHSQLLSDPGKWIDHIEEDATKEILEQVLSAAQKHIIKLTFDVSYYVQGKLPYPALPRELCAHLVFQFCRSASQAVQNIFSSDHLADLKTAFDLYRKYQWIREFFSANQAQIASQVCKSPYLPNKTPLQLSAMLAIQKAMRPFLYRDKPIYHYTTLKTLEILTRPGASFHLSNTAYLNDPQEGFLGIDMLKDGYIILSKKGSKPQKRWYPFSSSSSEIFVHNSFIASFMKRGDVLPMWVQYGSNGSGCCLEISPSSVTEPLYAVTYDSQKLKTSFFKVKKALKEYLHNCPDVDPTSDSVFQYSQGVLNLCCYLYKAPSYRHEEEVRVVAFAPLEKAKAETSARPGESFPRVYWASPLIKSRPNDAGLSFSSIILGPTVQNPEYIVTALAQRGYDPSIITQSKIRFR